MTIHDLAVSLLIAGMASGSFLLHRFLFPRSFVFFPTWRSSYIAATLLFLTLFVYTLFE